MLRFGDQVCNYHGVGTKLLRPNLHPDVDPFALPILDDARPHPEGDTVSVGALTVDESGWLACA